jgi:hypothetical protein
MLLATITALLFLYLAYHNVMAYGVASMVETILKPSTTTTSLLSQM